MRIADLVEEARRTHTGVGPNTPGVYLYVFDTVPRKDSTWRMYKHSVFGCNPEEAAVEMLRCYNRDGSMLTYKLTSIAQWDDTKGTWRHKRQHGKTVRVQAA